MRELYDSFALHFFLVWFTNVSTYLCVSDSEKVICTCLLIHLVKNIRHTVLWWMGLVQQVVRHPTMKCIKFKHTYQMKTFCLLKSIRSRVFSGCWIYLKLRIKKKKTQICLSRTLGLQISLVLDWKPEQEWLKEGAWGWGSLWRKQWRYFHSHTMQSKSVCSCQVIGLPRMGLMETS